MEEVQSPEELANTIRLGLFVCAGVGVLLLLALIAGITVFASNIRRK